jgi:nicotinate-nucleotide--dimethylbenzimidazole phosphoribosyltransferase
MTHTQTTGASLEQSLQHKINLKTKPTGALGRLEEIALQVGSIQQSLNPQINNPHIIVFAGDHGIAKTGLVNPYPQEVTAQMVLNFLNGGAAINVFCRQNNIALKVVDAGINFDWNNTIANSNFINAKIGYGTKNYLEEPAMTEAEVNRAIEKGKEIVAAIHQAGCNCIGFGEMGIANTSSASLIMSAILQIPIEECVGRGTGVNDEQLKTKIDTLKRVTNKHALFLTHHSLSGVEGSPLTILQTFGGFEIVMMAGAYLEAAKRKMIIVVDGFISTAALLAAKTLSETDTTLSPFVGWGLIFAHCSDENGHRIMLNFLNAKPLLQLGMRLGEGTGAALAIPLIQASVNFLNEMASFETAGVSNKE